MNDFAARKRLLIAQADLHRQLVAVERLRLEGRWHAAHNFGDRNRWWLLAGAIAGGVLLARDGRGLVRWLPILIATWRTLKG